ncbi:conserved hypothetical protein [Frankia canadensis]|uniref:Uncharacterized protein n=1 Tax=Frankia canadensis TaxID=1836972 RepID=A0A2I2KZI5_9ACTN|nr:DUF5336 domain-containing protein [Frankia canadensis]SNQ51076.1 conserved hypothetical protein [Frankia canadensis]SOU58366.1 conserved hypothetical protein [Frankia canadensis]
MTDEEWDSEEWDTEGWEGPRDSVNSSNTASNGARVGAQFGVNRGRVDIRNSPTYVYQGDSPEEQCRVALNYLRADSARPAEEILRKLMWGGQPTTRIAYYYTLSVLGDRSVYELDSELIEEIRKARAYCSDQAQDSWCQAQDVVMGLLRSLPHGTARESTADAEQWNGEWEDLLAFDKVPSERQEEIRRSLAMIASGRVREQLESGVRERVVAEKVRADRVRRVWMFFHPDPLEPKLYPLPPLEAPLPSWQLIAGGPLLLCAGTVLVGMNHWWVAIMVLGIQLGGVRLLGPLGVESRARRLVAEAEERNAQRLRTLPDPRSPGHWVSSGLVRDLCRVVEDQFTEARPHRNGTWAEQTVEVRAYLKERLVAQYGNSQRSADTVAWLARWHARRAATPGGPAWQPRDLDEAAPAGDTITRRPPWLGAVAAVATLGVLFAVGQVVSAVLLGVGAVWVVLVSRRQAASRRAIALREDAQQRLLVEEQRGLDEWREILADRPSDEEMARWLAMDKAHVRYEAIERAGLVERDVVTHAVMVEGAKGARALRLASGPPRYSAYTVRVFVLSHSGVHEVNAKLDFHTGDILDEQRNHFSYEKVASVSAREKGARRVRNVKGQATQSEKLRAAAVTVRLVSGENAVSVRESYRRPTGGAGLDGQDEDLAELVLRDSGFEGVLRILESVASEGGGWIRRDRERRARWAHSLFD